jgi:hypothetical protein
MRCLLIPQIYEKHAPRRNCATDGAPPSAAPVVPHRSGGRTARIRSRNRELMDRLSTTSALVPEARLELARPVKGKGF